jgi:hypothetical protein
MCVEEISPTKGDLFPGRGEQYLKLRIEYLSAVEGRLALLDSKLSMFSASSMSNSNLNMAAGSKITLSGCAPHFSFPQ